MLMTVLVLACVHNRRFPRSIGDLLMLRGKKYESPSLLEGSIRNDRGELEELTDSDLDNAPLSL